MVRKSSYLAAAIMVALLGAAEATPFLHEIDFSGTGTYIGEDYLRVEPDYLYTHDPTYPAGPPASIDSAVLTIMQTDNAAEESLAFYPENWSVYTGGGIFIGDLSNSAENGGSVEPLEWVEDSFTLSPAVLAEMASNDFKLEVRLTGITYDDRVTDLFLGKSTLSGEYTPGTDQPIPEASTLMLFGSGLSGLAFYVRKRKLLKS